MTQRFERSSLFITEHKETTQSRHEALQYELLVPLEVERMLGGGEKSKWGVEEIEKALLHLL